MAFDYRYDQLMLIHDAIEWLYHNEYMKNYFTAEDNPMKHCLLTEIIPILVTYCSIIK